MDRTWNLDLLYRGFEDPRFEADLEELKKQGQLYCQLVEQAKDADARQALKEILPVKETRLSLYRKLYTYCRLRRSVDASDAMADSMMGKLNALNSDCAGADVAFSDRVCQIPDLQAVISGDELLEDYGYYLSEIRRKNGYNLSEEGETVMARMSISGGTAWAGLQGMVYSNAQVAFRGKPTGLPALRNMVRDPDPAVRKEAFEAEMAAYEPIKDTIAHCLNAVKLEAINQCAIRGYESVLDRSLVNANLKKETLDALFAAVEEYLPAFRKYFKAKAKLLGHEKGLPWYDVMAPVGVGKAEYTIEEAEKILVDTFSEVDEDLTAMVKQAFRDRWIDFYPRKGKRGGAFCASVHSEGISYVMTNFSGRFGAVVTLAHELGHAFHSRCLKGHRPLNKQYPLPLAETASNFNENLVVGGALKAAKTPEEQLFILEFALSGNAMDAVDIYSRFLFESRVVAERPDRFLNAETLCSYMHEAQLRTYGDGLDPDCTHPYMWANKPHYYGYHFYNYPYMFGGLFSLGLYAMYEKEGQSFLPKYKELLYKTTVASTEEVTRAVGIDITKKDFWRGALDIVSQRIDLFCRLAEETREV